MQTPSPSTIPCSSPAKRPRLSLNPDLDQQPQPFAPSDCARQQFGGSRGHIPFSLSPVALTFVPASSSSSPVAKPSGSCYPPAHCAFSVNAQSFQPAATPSPVSLAFVPASSSPSTVAKPSGSRHPPAHCAFSVNAQPFQPAATPSWMPAPPPVPDGRPPPSS